MRSLISFGFLAPPVLFIMLALVGTMFSLKWPRTGIGIALASNICLFASATTALSSYTNHQLEMTVSETADFSQAQAIVVLGADIESGEGESLDWLGPLSLERVLFAVDAYRRLNLPVAVSGGPISDAKPSLAAMLKATFENYFNVPVKWTEDRSRNTFENALYTTTMLRDENITTVVLVTQSRDLPRAIWSFEQAGLHAIPWHTPRTPIAAEKIADFLPNTAALQASFYGFHELLGGLYYRLRYRTGNPKDASF
jgi:uncharacterized SAM-binding protein YcdF (DUF218 family)